MHFEAVKGLLCKTSVVPLRRHPSKHGETTSSQPCRKMGMFIYCINVPLTFMSLSSAKGTLYTQHVPPNSHLLPFPPSGVLPTATVLPLRLPCLTFACPLTFALPLLVPASLHPTYITKLSLYHSSLPPVPPPPTLFICVRSLRILGWALLVPSRTLMGRPSISLPSKAAMARSPSSLSAICAHGAMGGLKRNEKKEAEGTQELHPSYTRDSSRLITLFHLHHPPPWPGPCTLRGQSTPFLPPPGTFDRPRQSRSPWSG